MRLRVVGGVAVLALACTWSWGAGGATRGAKGTAARTKPAAAPAKAAAPSAKLLVNGKPAEGAVILRDKVPLLRLRFAVATVPSGRTGVTIEETGAGETTLSRPEAIVRIKPGAKQMYVDGQSVPLPTAVTGNAAGLYIPVEVLQALYPEYTVALSYEVAKRTVQFRYEAKQTAAAPAPAVTPPAASPTATLPAAPPAASSAACAPSSAGRGVATQEFGKKGAKVDIVAALPITHGCHVQTEAELKKAYEKHPDEVHLVIYDLFGTEGQGFVAAHGGPRAVVFINEKTSFDLGGRRVRLEMREGGLYTPADLVPIVEQELGAK